MAPSSRNTTATEAAATRRASLLRCRLDSEAALLAFGARLAGILYPGDTIGLEGVLGSGKTVLARGVIRGLLGAPVVVTSPTYPLVQIYDAGEFEIWHCDLYRLDGPRDALELGIEEAFAAAVCLVEWPDRLGAILPTDSLSAALAPGDPGERYLTLSGTGDWPARLERLEDSKKTKGRKHCDQAG